MGLEKLKAFKTLAGVKGNFGLVDAILYLFYVMNLAELDDENKRITNEEAQRWIKGFPIFLRLP